MNITVGVGAGKQWKSRKTKEVSREVSQEEKDISCFIGLSKQEIISIKFEP